MTMQVLVIGLDGVSESILEPMLADGQLPSLAAIHDRGTTGPLESILPPWTPSAWPSLFTGVNPGKHGVYDFLHFDGYDWNIVNRTHVKEYAIWELLSERGFTSVVLNVPVTHPPRSFDGVLVPGYVGPDHPACHPAEVEELVGIGEDYAVYGSTLDSTASDETIGDELERLVDLRKTAFCQLVTHSAPDFGFVQFQATDTVFHDCPDADEIIRSVFTAVDRAIGVILETCNPELVLVVSDHGMGRMEGYEFRVNDYLREHGYLETTPEGGGMPSWQSLARENTDAIADGALTTTAKSALELAARFGVTAQRVGWLLRTLRLKHAVMDAIPVDVIRAGTEQVDFAASMAYMRTRTEMGVRLNLKGREPTGVISPAEYDAVRSEVITLLEAATTPTDNPVFDAVIPREAVFNGPYLEDAPDIITVPHEFNHFLVANIKGDIFGEPTEPWEHKRNGLVMASGQCVDPHQSLGDAHLFDIAPTILAAFGLPICNRMDGTPLPIVDQTERTAYPAFEPKGHVETNDALVEERLGALGYLE